MSEFPERSETKAMNAPSEEKLGERSSQGPDVTGMGVPPEAGATYM
jgi:hypothetical protein